LCFKSYYIFVCVLNRGEREREGGRERETNGQNACHPRSEPSLKDRHISMAFHMTSHALDVYSYPIYYKK